MKSKILELKNLNKSFLKEDGSEIKVLSDININFCEGEIIGVIGRSGCGKSTLLKIITGLIPITSGEILLNNRPIEHEEAKISMVFQTFGLFPWLTVYENIALGLKTKVFDTETIKTKVFNAIELVGLLGFKDAYPREISGGMRQRVGFARAMVVDPEILVLDEPFSALDYLTSNILKSDLLDLWFERSISSIKSIILVTHSIEEAISLCDRIILLSSNPGTVIEDIKINIPHPRDPESQEFKGMQEYIYANLSKNTLLMPYENVNLKQQYPQSASILRMIGFLTCLKQVFNGHAEIQEIADRLQLNYDTVTPVIESLVLLKFIELDTNKISITSAGNILFDADDEAKKAIMKEHLVKYVSFIKNIYHNINASKHKRLRRKDLLLLLKDKFGDEDAENIVDYTINWTRYVELFSYNANHHILTLSR